MTPILFLIASIQLIHQAQANRAAATSAAVR